MSLYRILLVYPETQMVMGAEIRNELEEKLQIPVDWVKNETAAQTYLNDPQSNYHLIITALHIPSGPKTPLHPGELRGLVFLQSRSQENQQTPSILVAPAEDEELSKSLRKLPNSELVLEGGTIFDDLLGYSQKLLSKATYQESAPAKVLPVAGPAVKQEIANINIKIKLDDRISLPNNVIMVKGEYQIKGYRFNYFKEGEIALDFRTLKKLAKKSKELETETGWPEWKKILHFVGETLKKEICDNNYKFQDYFLEIVKMVKGIENTRIRFNLTFGDKATEDEEEQKTEEDLHSVVLEALMDFEEKEFLMLQAPICRRLDFKSSAFLGEYPLFHEKDSNAMINCLIIEADTWGYTALKKDGKGVELKRLAHLKEESDWLEKNLGKMGQVSVGDIRRISEDNLPSNYNFKDYLNEVLKKHGPWHLVHYAGHSLYDDQHVGYVFFPLKEDFEPIKIEVFCKDLRGARPQFVYLSSCYSSGADFVFQLANHGIPAILGFRWGIDDDKAGECAKIFYQYLFETRSLEEAFWKTRRDVHEKYQENKIWAAPLLIYQTCD